MLYNEATVDGDAEHQCSPPHWPPKKKEKKKKKKRKWQPGRLAAGLTRSRTGAAPGRDVDSFTGAPVAVGGLG